MNHSDHVELIRAGIPSGSPVDIWADFGSGGGAFTLALADLLDAGAAIISVDRDSRALREQQAAMQTRFPDRHVTYRAADFTQRLDLPPLDGVLMANSLHFVRDKAAVLALVRGYLKPDGRLILVEYNADRGNTRVPYPLSMATWVKLAADSGFKATRQLSARPSRFLSEIYSALSLK